MDGWESVRQDRAETGIMNKPRHMANGILKVSHWWGIMKSVGYGRGVSVPENQAQICRIRGVDIIH